MRGQAPSTPKWPRSGTNVGGGTWPILPPFFIGPSHLFSLWVVWTDSSSHRSISPLFFMGRLDRLPPHQKQGTPIRFCQSLLTQASAPRCAAAGGAQSSRCGDAVDRRPHDAHSPHPSRNFSQMSWLTEATACGRGKKRRSTLLPCAVVVAATCYGCTAIVATVAVISDIIFRGSMTWSRRRAVAPHSSCGKKTTRADRCACLSRQNLRHSASRAHGEHAFRPRTRCRGGARSRMRLARGLHRTG